MILLYTAVRIVNSFIYVLMYRVDLIRMNTFEKVIIHWDRNCYFHYNYIFITITNLYIFIQRDSKFYNFFRAPHTSKVFQIFMK